VKVQKG